MQMNNPVTVVGIFFLVLFFVALMVGLAMQRRRAVRSALPKASPDRVKSMTSPPPVGGERIASTISEAIEDMVRERMAAEPSLQGVVIDFGSSPDGALEIWIDDERYENLDEIHDERIRTLIQQAVDAYNQGAG